MAITASSVCRTRRPVTLRGAPGPAATSTGVDPGDIVPTPARFEARTVTLYAVPVRSPRIVHFEAPCVWHVLPPGHAVAT